MVNPWILLGVAVMWALSLFAVGKWQREDGRTAERVEWQARDNKALAEANAKIESLNDAARATEQAHADRLAAIGAHNVKENQDAEIRLRRAVDGARALVLRQQPACPSPGGSEAGPPTPTAGLGNGQAGCELPAASVRDLFRLVGDADRDVRQLDDCQAVVLSDRKDDPP